ncbi:HAD hydrolase family protein [bacterium]|nr:HAD hydrolase family protein [bacterium]
MPHWLGKNPTDEQLRTLRSIRALALDVDGVLTTGGIIYGTSGMEIKRFDCKDGLGLRLWLKAGHELAIITGRESVAVSERARDLGLKYVYQGCGDKKEVMKRFSYESKIPLAEICAIGDDIIDIPMMSVCGLPAAVGDASRECQEAAQLIALKSGGCGAVREVVEYILKGQGLWEKVIAQYYE